MVIVTALSTKVFLSTISPSKTVWSTTHVQSLSTRPENRPKALARSHGHTLENCPETVQLKDDESGIQIIADGQQWQPVSARKSAYILPKAKQEPVTINDYVRLGFVPGG